MKWERFSVEFIPSMATNTPLWKQIKICYLYLYVAKPERIWFV